MRERILVPNKRKIDKILLFSFLALVALSVLTFLSASLALTRISVDLFYSAVIKHLVLGYVLGFLLLFGMSKINYRIFLNPYVAYGLFAIALILTGLVFVPGLGIEAGGAKRWISVFGITFQSSELLKVAVIILISALTYVISKKSRIKRKHQDIKGYWMQIITIGAISTGLLLAQPDTGTLVVLLAGVLAILFASGLSWKNILIVILLAIVGLAGLALARPYVLDRIMTFINPSDNLLTSDYHINQSLIAIGSGGLFGLGYGQSMQKFKYLPEPTSDSIFSVYAEEMGFVGVVVLLIAYATFLIRAIIVSKKVMMNRKDEFAYYLSVGIVFLIFTQTFLNIASMTNIAPLTGLPLPFASRGGSSVSVLLFAVGILFSVSRYMPQKRLHRRKPLFKI